MRTFPTLFSLTVVAHLAACKGNDERWQASRTQYCHRLESVALQVDQRAAAARDQLEEAGLALDPTARAEACGRLGAQLAHLHGYLTGFEAVTSVLSLGRNGQDVREAGFVLNTPSEPMVALDSKLARLCVGGRTEAVLEELAKAESETKKRIEDRVDACRSVGWEPAG